MGENEILSRVFQKVSACLGSLVGSSGHMATYSVSMDSFRIVATEQLADGLRRHEFAAEALYESEFTVYSEDHQPEFQKITGHIVLDRDYNLTRDEKGSVRFGPWNCIDPEKVSKKSHSELLSADEVDALLRAVDSEEDTESS